uniref:Wsv303-like protein n=1 Tax=Metopaulias depressus WSSV-like virus TaxID=1675544 RepID=A0A0K0VL49_9VIRU|nr:wsv303-like protein [Metopaulias depressus WSSV-like virus]
MATECERKKHVILGNVDYVLSSTDNNCVSISIDFGKNVGFEQVEERIDEEDEDDHKVISNAVKSGGGKVHLSSLTAIKKSKKMQPQPSKTVISRARMILSERDTSQKQFTALKSRAPFFSVLKFETGAVIVVGLQDPALTNLCVSKAVTDIADTLKYPIRIRNVSIVNTVSTFNRFHLNFIRIGEFFDRHCIAYIYNPETFPGMFFKLRVPVKKLKEGETLGEYYTKVAAMRDSKCPSFNISEWFRVKTVLTFKVGKNTVLGECGRDDVSVISKLLFGLFHYFMDHNIKLSPSEARRIRDRYGIPSLEWYLYVDMLFHSHPYVKPTKEEVRLSMMIASPTTTAIDKTYYGDYPDSPLSANLLPPGKETSRIVDAMIAQKLCGPLTMHRKGALISNDSKPRGWWRKNTRPDPFTLIRVGTTSEAPAGMMNGKLAKHDGEWWLEKNFNNEKEHLTNLCHEEIVKECEANNLIPAAFMRNFTLSESQERLMRVISRIMDGQAKYFGNRDNYSLLGVSRSKKIKQDQKKHAVNLARLDTHMAAYKFLNRHLINGLAPELAELFGTDVYSLLHLVKKLPKTRGHSLSVNNQTLKNSSSAYKTPGDAYFSRLFDEAVKANNNHAKKTNVERDSAATLSQFKCEACGNALIKGSRSVERGLCEACDEQSTLYIKNALSAIRRNNYNKKRPFEEEEENNDYHETEKESKKVKKCTPSDFIDSVFKFKDELTGIPKVGLEFKVNDILNSLSDNRSMEDRPTANYRTSFHTDTQNKSNLKNLLVAALKENGATEDEAQIFNRILKNGKGLDILCELAARGKKQQDGSK